MHDGMRALIVYNPQRSAFGDTQFVLSKRLADFNVRGNGTVSLPLQGIGE